MFLSSSFLKSCYDKIYPTIIISEDYHQHHKIIKKQDDMISLLMFYISILFFIVELILFYYAMIITLNCSANKHEMIINTILSITFTTPFVLFQLLSNPCAKEAIIKLN